MHWLAHLGILPHSFAFTRGVVRTESKTDERSSTRGASPSLYDRPITLAASFPVKVSAVALPKEERTTQITAPSGIGSV